MAVETAPSGATVLLDGASVGTSPLSMGDLTPGPHIVRVESEGYGPAEVGLHLVSGAQSAPIRFTLHAVEALLTVRSTPEGGSVFVDDEPLGKTPLANIPVKPGVHSVLVESEGYQAWSRAVETRVGQETTLDAPLEPSTLATQRQARATSWVAEGDLVEMGQGVDPPIKLSGGAVVYPSQAVRLRLQGAVTVEMIVTQKGDVEDPRIVESAGELLDRAVLAAVSGWRFEPARKNGVKVQVRYSYKQEFPWLQRQPRGQDAAGGPSGPLPLRRRAIQ